MNQSRYLSVTGPTGSGKSFLARSLAKSLDGEIVNCDSVQLYKGFDVGSAKESKEDQQGIPHHLIDILEPVDTFDAARFANLARKTIEEINSRNKLPIVVGGTGLYLRALWGEKFHDLPTDQNVRDEIEKLSNQEIMDQLKEKDPNRANFLHINDRVRLVRSMEIVTLTGKPIEATTQDSTMEFPPTCLIHIQPKREILLKRIEKRTKKMLAEGLIEEVENLRQKGIPIDIKPMESIGYLQVNKFLDETLDRKELEERIIIATRQYAKRQVTWFNKVKKDFELEEAIISEDLLEKIKLKLSNL